MITHGDRHLPGVQRPHTHGPHTRSVTHSCLIHTHPTTRTLPCIPGLVPIRTTAATRHFSRHSRSRCLHSRLAHLRATTPRLLSTFTLIPTPGDAAACSCMATVISRVYSDLTHAVLTHPTHGRSLTHCASSTHTTPAGALTRGVSFTHRAVLLAPAVSSACGASSTRGFIHTCRFSRARGFFPLRCPFNTRRAGKHARRHIRHHTTRTRGLTLTNCIRTAGSDVMTS